MPCLTGRGEKGFSLTEKTKKGTGRAGGGGWVFRPCVAQPRIIRAVHSKKKEEEDMSASLFFFEKYVSFLTKKEFIYIYMLDPLSSTSRLRRGSPFHVPLNL